STLCLYNYLRSNPGKKLLVYHVNLKNWEGRQDLENHAVHRILEWMRKNALDDFEYLEMTFDYGNVRRILWDSELWGFIDGLVLRDVARKNAIQNIICPYIKTEHQTVMLNGRHKTR